MNLFGLMEASGSAMQAERVRAEVVAANMANAETTRTESGGPYRRQHVIFEANAKAPSFADILGNSTSASIASNLLPLSTTTNKVAGGVHVAGVIQDPASPLKRYDPGHPDAGPHECLRAMGVRCEWKAD